MKVTNAVVIIKDYLGFTGENHDYDEETLKEAINTIEKFINKKSYTEDELKTLYCSDKTKYCLTYELLAHLSDIKK